MRSSGFPCRSAGCERIFRVADQSSMASLTAASAARAAHEVGDHGYHHAVLPEAPRRNTFSPPRPKERKA